MTVLRVSLMLLPALLAGQTGPEPERAEQLIQQAWKETKAAGDDQQPAQKWAEVLWQYREQRPATAGAARATGEALHLLIHAAQIDRAITKAESLKLDDPAWKHVANILLEAGERKKDYTYAIHKASAVLPHSKDPAVRAAVGFALGNAYWRSNRLEEAKAAFESVVKEGGDSGIASQARGNIYELTHLQAGQPAPAFEAPSTAGAAISLAALKGKVVLLHFWASW